METNIKISKSDLGCGVGLRPRHYPVITSEWPAVDWFEAVTENYMDTGGRPLEILEKVRKHYPVALHGVALSIGSVDRLNEGYLSRWKTLIDRIDPVIVSDHICWSGVGGEQLHDLLPLPFTEEALTLLTRRVGQIQEFLGRKILLENVSSYVTFKHSAIPEWEFIRALAEKSGCSLLLDINNVFVNAKNHSFDAHEYIRSIPAESVEQIHLAGHADHGAYLFDTHGSPVIDQVWALYEEALSIWGKKPTLIEWDENIPEFPRLMEEANKAKGIYSNVAPAKAGAQFKKLDSRFRGNDIEIASYGASDSSPSLNAVEYWFRDKIFPKNGKIMKEENLLNTQGGETGETRLSVYREGYYARTHEALCEVYEAVRKILGAEEFLKLSEKYAAHYSSPNYNLNIKGAKLSEFLQHSDYNKRFPFLFDLARLEWAIAESFHAFLRPAFDPASLAGINAEDWGNLKIKFQPSVRLIGSAWPIIDFWQARKNPKNQAVKTNVKNSPHYILIFRSADSQVYCELLDQKQYIVLQNLLFGSTLGDSLESLLNDDVDVPVDAWFSRWIQSGLITECGIAVAEPSTVP